MLSFTELVTISAGAEAVWSQLVDLERWWVASNPEHDWLEILSSDKKVAEGVEIHFEESVAGVRGVAEGRIVALNPGVEAAWEGRAVYRYMGMKIPVQEGVTWRVAVMSADLTMLSASVSAEFSRGVLGGLAEWYAMTLMDLERRDREHARRELRYLKELVEGR